jgi:hypothetical protein
VKATADVGIGEVFFFSTTERIIGQRMIAEKMDYCSRVIGKEDYFHFNPLMSSYHVV